LEALLKREDNWPPNAVEFRDLCLKNSKAHAKNHAAYIDFNDPAHPDYRPPRIESDSMKSERESIALTELNKMKAMF